MEIMIAIALHPIGYLQIPRTIFGSRHIQWYGNFTKGFVEKISCVRRNDLQNQKGSEWWKRKKEAT